jgi:hypothetical protein
MDSTSGSRSKKQGNLDDMLMRLGIDEDEIDDLVFEDEEDVLKQGMKWMALARVHTANSFSPQTFEQHMRVSLGVLLRRSYSLR